MDQNKKNSSLLYIVVAIIIIIVLILLVSTKNKTETLPTNEPITEGDIELNNAITSDSTLEIQNSLDQIDVTDTTAKDLEDVDKDLNSL